METKKLLELRRVIKKKKPRFIRQSSLRKKLCKKWRRPKGIHSKMRLSRGGKAANAQAGYGSPKAVKGLSREGLIPIIINTEKDLEEIDSKNAGIIIASNVGLKKRIELVKRAAEKGLKLLNIKDADKLMKKWEQKRAEKKKQREEKKKKPAKLPKKKLEEKLTEEEKRREEKKEKEKVLTKRA